MPLPNRFVLGLFAKWPRAGQVKTRLATATSPEWAAQVALAFLRDTVERLTSIPTRRVLAFAPTGALADFAGIVQDRFEMQPQTEGDLGQRMAAFFSGWLADGAERVVLVGTDSPTLPIAHIETAFDALARADVVLGPATDGGYYLVGCARRLPPIFSGIAWGGNRVLADTIDRIKEAKLPMALLPPWYDVDTLGDWQMLRGHIAAMRCAGEDPRLPFTEELLNAQAT